MVVLVPPVVVPVPEEVHERAEDEQEVRQEPERMAPVLAQNEERDDDERGPERELGVPREAFIASRRKVIGRLHVGVHDSTGEHLSCQRGASRLAAIVVLSPVPTHVLRRPARNACPTIRTA